MTVAKAALRGSAGYVAPTSVVASDTFTRTSTTTLGSADTGQAWTAHAGTWGTNGTQAYLVTQASDSFASIDVGKSDFDFSCDVTIQGGPGLVFRTNGTDFLLAFYNPGNGLQFYRRISGTYTLLGTAVTTLGAGSTATWRIVTAGSSLTLYVGGVQQLQVTEANLLTATRVGLRVNDASASRFDNLTVQ